MAAGPRLRWSVRARITTLAALVVGVTLLVAAWGLVTLLDHSLVGAADEVSKAQLETLADRASRGDLPQRLDNLGDDGVGQVVTANGRVLASSTGLAGHGPVASDRSLGAEPQLRVLDDVPDDDETESYRAWARTTVTPDGPVTIYVGSSLESVHEATATLRKWLTLGFPVLLVTLVAGTWVVVGRALAPVEGIRREVAAISDGELDRRLAVPATGDEVARLAETMNTMLEQLAAVHERQRQFVADASHELQSPLASVRTELEVALAHGAAVDWPELAGEVLGETDRMERLVRNLLYLARQDAGGDSSPDQLVDLDVVVQEEVVRARALAGVAVDASRVSAAPVRGSADDLRRLVRNLLDNAVHHAASDVRLELSTQDTRVVLVVRDDGPGIPTDQRARVFERFARVEADRSRPPAATVVAPAGTGLGLAIARAIARRHGGDIVIDGTEGGGTSVVVTLPPT